METERNSTTQGGLASSLGKTHHFGFLITGLFLLIVVVWGGYVPISKAITFTGQLRSTAQTVEIQYPIDASLAQVRVHEGKQVRRGETLAVMDTSELTLRRDSSRRLLSSLKLERLRLKSELSGASTIQVSENLSSEISALDMLHIQEQEQQQLTRALEYRRREEVALEARRGRLDETIDHLTQRLSFETQQIAFAQNAAEPFEGSRADGRTSASELANVRRTYLGLQARAAETHADLAKARLSLSEVSYKLTQIPSRRNSDLTNRITHISRMILEQEAIVAQSEVAIEAAAITSPVTGTVANLRYDTAGANVPRNAPLMSIMPAQGGTQIELQIPPEDVNTIKLDAIARVALRGYQKQGNDRIDAGVTRISPSVVSKQHQAASYHIVTLEFDPDAIVNAKRSAANALELRPGMLVDAYFETGTQTFLAYLIEPLQRSFTWSLAN